MKSYKAAKKTAPRVPMKLTRSKAQPAAKRIDFVKNVKMDIGVPFPFIYETHDSKKFQADGHMLPALRHRDPDGNPVQGPQGNREWGPVVHILKMPHPQDPSETIIQKLSDSLDEVRLMVMEELPRCLVALWTAQFCRESEAGSFERLNRERNNLRDYVVAKEGLEKFELIAGGGVK